MGDPYYEDGAASGRGYDDDESYYLGPNPLDEPRRLPAAVIDAAPPSPAASGFDSDATIYDDDMEGAGNGAAVAPAAPAPAPGKKGFKCRLCAKEFDSIKAVNGHTKVHATAAKGSKARRGGKAPQVDYHRSHISMAIAAAAAAAAAPEEPPKLLPAPAVAVAVVQHDGPKPVQLAIASTTTTATPNHQSAVAVKELSKSDSSPMDNQQQQENSSMTPPPATELAEPEPKPQQEEEEQQAAMAKPLLPSAAQSEEQAVVVYQQPAAGNNGNNQQQQQPPAGNNSNSQQRGYFPCKEEGCGKWYPTHQGLGGHAAGHKNKRLRQEALAAGGEGAMACHGAVAKPAKMHACDQCDMVYARGQELGGHKRRHYQGKPIVPKKKKKQEAQQQPAQQAAAPVVERVVRLFGVDIGKAQQAQQQELAPVDDKQ